MAKASKDEIIDYAKHLFFENKSFQKIADLVGEKFNEKFGKSTIKSWADKLGWQGMKDLAIAKGVYVAKKDKDNHSEQIPLIGSDEKLKDKLSKDTAKQYKEAQEIRNIGLNLTKIHALTPPRTGGEKGNWNKDFSPKHLAVALQAFKAGSDDMRKLEELADRANNFDPRRLSDDELEKIING